MKFHFRKYSEKLSSHFHFDLDRAHLTATLYEDLHAFLLLSCYIFTGEKNVPKKYVRKSENTFYVQNTSISGTVFEIVNKGILFVHLRTCMFGNKPWLSEHNRS
jgi:hypothetical protein